MARDILFIFFISAFVLFFGCVSDSQQTPIPPPFDYQPKQVCFHSFCVFVEVADSDEERAIGLMNRDSLAENYGMLFVFDTEEMHGFWMKNTRIPLDALWINGKYQIVDIQTMVPCEEDPCMIYTPAQKALYVVEVPGGVAQKSGIETGEFVQFRGV